jgi:hypothetical protein
MLDTNRYPLLGTYSTPTLPLRQLCHVRKARRGRNGRPDRRSHSLADRQAGQAQGHRPLQCPGQGCEAKIVTCYPALVWRWPIHGLAVAKGPRRRCQHGRNQPVTQRNKPNHPDRDRRTGEGACQGPGPRVSGQDRRSPARQAAASEHDASGVASQPGSQAHGRGQGKDECHPTPAGNKVATANRAIRSTIFGRITCAG